MAQNNASSGNSGPPTKTIAAPDGSQIHYPNLPGLGEQYQPPTALKEVSHPQAHSESAAPPGPAHAAPETWRERIMSAARSAVERAGVYGHAAVQALVLDDWKALTDAHSTPLERIEAGADLASWAIPEGKVAEIAGHALAKVAEQTASHLATAGMEDAAEHVTAAAALGSRWAARSENAKIAEQHVANESNIWDRPLTDSERQGAFKSKDDLTALLGPATERGGPKRDWHHVVESSTESRFGADRVHNVKNVVAIERNPIHRDISKEFQQNDRLLPRGPDGNEQSLRTFLKDKPWERHVAEGEQRLLDRGLDPARLRTETLDRFEKRIELHERLLGQSQELGKSKIIAPGVLTSVDRNEQARDGDRGAAHDAKPSVWSPNMPLEDFATLQAQIRGGSASRDRPVGLHYQRDGSEMSLPAARRFEGRIESVDGDRIVQNIGRQGHTVTWSREELAGHFNDPKAFDAMMQPGHYVTIGADRNGTVDVQQRLPDHSWQSLGNQPIVHQQSLGISHGR
jgi:hypothetical protein